MKRILLTIFLSFILCSVNAAHIKGGFLSYKYLGPGISNPSFARYKITLTIYMACNPSSGQLTDAISLTIFNGNGTQQVDNLNVYLISRFNLGKVTDDPAKVAEGQAKQASATVRNAKEDLR